MYRDSLLAARPIGSELPPAWQELGFKFGDKGAHTSRTIMLAELSALLHRTKPDATRADFVHSLIEENCLGKHTASTRQLTLQRLTELYALDLAVPLFRLFRLYWDADEKSHSQLALLLALARDPLLRATADPVLDTIPGEEIARQKLTNALREAVSGRLNDAILDKVVRNTASSWTQSGHLDGRNRKKRVRLTPTPTSTAFAAVLGYLMGARGGDLFQTFFARVLDRDAHELTFLAMDAKRIGLLDLKQGGGMLVVSFDGVLTDKEKELAYGST